MINNIFGSCLPPVIQCRAATFPSLLCSPGFSYSAVKFRHFKFYFNDNRSSDLLHAVFLIKTIHYAIDFFLFNKQLHLANI